jgi:hypothetical protein
MFDCHRAQRFGSDRVNAAEQVTRMELAWPAWKVAITLRTRAISGGEMCSGDTVKNH